MRDRAKSDKIARQVLIVIAMHIVAVGASRRRMADRDARHDAHRETERLRLVSHGGDACSRRIDVDGVIVCYDSAAEGGGGGGRIGIGVFARQLLIGAISPHEIERIVARRPRVWPSLPDVVTSWLPSTGVDDALFIHIH